MNWDDVPDADYRRTSVDRTGERRGTSRQGEDNSAVAARAGRSLHPRAYVDASVSAADAAVVRPEFERLIGDLVTGVVNGIVVSCADRLVRRFGDLQRLIDVWDRAAQHGRLIRPILTSTRAYDLHVQSDVMMLAIDVITGDQEIRTIRRRVARYHVDNAQKGRVAGGPRPFGWNDDRRTLNPVEAGAVREAVTDIMAGVTGWGQIAIRWNDAGLLTPFGNTWIGSNVRATLRNPRLAAIRTHKGEPIVNDDGSYVIGQWEPILTLDRWEAYWSVVATDRGGGKDKPQSTHILSGVLRCSKCRKKMSGKRTSGKGLIYACPSRGAGGCGGTTIRGRTAEDLVVEAYLRHEEERQFRRVSPEDVKGNTELAEVRTSLDTLFWEIQDGKPASRRMAAIHALEAREADLMRQKNRASARREHVRRLTGDIRENWKGRSDREKRDALLDALAMVVVLPSDGARNRVNPDRLMPVWFEETEASAREAGENRSGGAHDLFDDHEWT